MIELVYDDWITIIPGATLYRVRAAEDMPWHGVHKGDLGGFVSEDTDVSSAAWVSSPSLVYDGSSVDGTSAILGNCIVKKSTIKGNSVLRGNSHVYDSTIAGDSQLMDATVSDGATVTSCGVYKSTIIGSVTIDNAYICGELVKHPDDIISVWGTLFPVTVGNKNISISEKTKTIHEWYSLTDDELRAELGERGLLWWKSWSRRLLGLTRKCSDEDCWWHGSCKH